MDRTKMILWALVGLNVICIAINIPFFPNPLNVFSAGMCALYAVFIGLVAWDY